MRQNFSEMSESHSPKKMISLDEFNDILKREDEGLKNLIIKKLKFVPEPFPWSTLTKYLLPGGKKAKLLKLGNIRAHEKPTLEEFQDFCFGKGPVEIEPIMAKLFATFLYNMSLEDIRERVFGNKTTDPQKCPTQQNTNTNNE
jgi:protoporphyrinogen oxidase